MSLTINSRLCIAPIGRPPVIRVGQYDSNFEIEFEMYTIDPITWDLEEGTTAMVRGTKTDKRGYSADCDIDIPNKKVTVYGDVQMTAAAGPCVYEIVLKKNDKEISSINFTLQVERAALDADTIPSESKIKEIQDIGQKADEIIEAYENLQFDSTPTAGSTKAVTSGGIKTYVDDATTTDTTLSETGKPADAEAVGGALDGKVDEPGTAGTAGQFLQKGENGNQWVDVETDVDATLTQEGVPADAKAVGDEVTDLKSAISAYEGDPSASATVGEGLIIDNNYDFDEGIYRIIATGNNISLRLHKSMPWDSNDPSNISVASDYTDGTFDRYIEIPTGYHYYRFYSGTVAGEVKFIKIGLDDISTELSLKQPKSFSKTIYANYISRGSFDANTGVFTPSATGNNYGTDFIQCYANAPVQYVRSTINIPTEWYLRFYYYNDTQNFVGLSEPANMSNKDIVADTAPSNACYFRIALAYVGDVNYLAVPFSVNVGTVYSESNNFNYCKSIITIAAHDSTYADKMSADVVCDGTNDEVEIQRAIDMLQANTRYHGGKIVLLNGTYVIDTLYDSGIESVGKIGLVIRNNVPYSQYGSITIEGTNLPNLKSNTEAGSCAVIQMSDSCFESLSDSEKVSIIGGIPTIENGEPVYKPCAGSWLFSNFAVAIQNPYKSVIGINAEWCWSLQISNIQFARTTNLGKSQLAHEIYNANEECIGLRTLHGLNNGSGFQIENVNVRGWGTGFDISGEHMTMIGCAARINKTGYRFGYLDNSSAHPNVLINCCDEVCINGIKLYGGGLHPTIEFISYNRELDNWEYELDTTEKIVYQSLAWEEYPGNYYGHVTYAINSAWNYINQADQAFWDDGCGINFRTVNLMDKTNGSTSNRPPSPQVNQMYFDTTINKAIWYVDGRWVDANGAVV